MRKKMALGVLVLVLAFMLAGCQGFLDDYSYNPVAAMSSNSNS